MPAKMLLVALTTNRDVEVGGKKESRRVRFAANKVVDLTSEEMKILDDLTKSTGKLHYRDPIQEGGSRPVAADPEIIDLPDYAGQDVAIEDKSVAQLKAYLTFHGVSFGNNDKRDDLVAAARKHESGQGEDKSGGSTDSGVGDPDGGL